MSNIIPAIVLVGYNRPLCIKRLMKSVVEAEYPCKDIQLVVSIDYSDKSDEIECIIKDIGWSHGTLRIIKQQKRQGLKRHILSCGDLSEIYGAVIILEDDLIVSKGFYNYAIKAINFYRNNKDICGVALYSHAWNGYANLPFHPVHNSYDVFWGQFSITWGQCWSAKQWKQFREWYDNFSEESIYDINIPKSIYNWGNQSWGKFFVYYLVINQKYYVIPYESLSTNCSEIGEHNIYQSATHQTYLLDASQKSYSFPLIEEAVRYDIFFERIFSNDMLIHGINVKDICVNLNGIKSNNEGKKYILTTRKEDGDKYITEFGLQLRPIEQNIVNNIEGTGIYLMAIEYKKYLKDNIGCSIQRRYFEIYDLYWKHLLSLVFMVFKNKTKDKFYNFLKSFSKK